MRNRFGTTIAVLVWGIFIWMGVLAVAEISNSNTSHQMSGLEPDVIYTIERLESLDGKLVVVVSKPGPEGEKVEIRTMLPELYTKPEGSHFMLPSEEEGRLVRVYDLD